MTTLILVRHGETGHNLENRFTGWQDVPLTERGITQARRAADYIAANYQPHNLYSSSLARALQTARAIGERVGLTPMVLDGLRERGLGQLEGLTRAEWAGTVDWNGALPGAEVAEDFRSRVLSSMNAILQNHSDQTTIVVSHGGPLAFFLAHLVAGRLEAWEKYMMDNGGVSVVRLESDHVLDFCFNESFQEN